MHTMNVWAALVAAVVATGCGGGGGGGGGGNGGGGGGGGEGSTSDSGSGGGGGADGGSSSQTCNVESACVNGSCTCTGGPNDKASCCDPSSDSSCVAGSANDCGTLCQVCTSS